VTEERLRTTISEVLHRIAPEVDISQIDPDGEMQDEMDLDSMDFLNLMVGLHERTGIEIPERDYPKVASLNGCVAYLAERAKVIT
jgi:acyl carrier protein